MGKRLFDGFFPKILEIVIVVAVVYGGITVTLGYLKDDMRLYKTKTDEVCLRVNTLETKFDYIKESLDRINKKLDGDMK